VLVFVNLGGAKADVTVKSEGSIEPLGIGRKIISFGYNTRTVNGRSCWSAKPVIGNVMLRMHLHSIAFTT